MAAVPTSIVAHVLAAVHGAKNSSPEDYNPFAREIQRRDALHEVDIEFARTFLQLVSEGVVPPWVAQIEDIQKIQLVANSV